MKMDFGVTGKLWEYGINSRTGAIAEKNVDGSFAKIAAAKVAEKEASLRSVNEMRTTGREMTFHFGNILIGIQVRML